MTQLPIAELGAVLPSPAPSEELKLRLAQRRSTPAQSITAPGPSPEEIDAILTLGARSPDHGKLFPWRFVVLGPTSRDQIAGTLRTMADGQRAPDKARAVLAKLTAAPVSVLVISSTVPNAKPIWEQELSAGAVCMNLLHAAGAYGYAANWITDWYSFDPEAAALFGVKPDEKVAGFIHIGSTTEAPLERARPDVASLTTRLP